MKITILHWLICMGILCTALPALALESTQPVPAITVSEDAAFNRYFNRCGPGWTGGDSTYSTPISATKVIWLFSDTFIGPVGNDGKRNPDTAMFVQGNTLAVQDTHSGTLTTYLRKTVTGADGQKAETQSLPTFTGAPYDSANCPNSSFIQQKDSLAMFQPAQCPSANHCYYWGGAVVADKKRLYTFLQLMQQTGTGAFDFAWHNSAIATIKLSKLGSGEPDYINIPNNGVSYGGAVLAPGVDNGKYTYIYGMRAEPASNRICTGHCIHVARAPISRLANHKKWQYWGVISKKPLQYGWTEKAKKTIAMAGSSGPAAAPMTQDQLGITQLQHCGKLPECYVIIAHQYTGGFTEDILAWYASQPQGPWTGPIFVYKTPESSQPGQLFTYNAKIHPAFTNESGLLVSYDVNSMAPFSDPLNAFITAASYRPRFIRVKLDWPL